MARETRRLLLAATLALLVVVAGCSGGADNDAQQATVAGDQPEDASADERAGDGGDAEFQGQSADYQANQREVIRTGTVSVRVESYDDARRNLTRATRELGGYVADSSEQVHSRGNRTWTTGKVVLRVPKENFSALLSQAKGAGVVQEASTNQQDVTDKLVDIDARLSNLRAQRDRLRDLYEQANDTEDVLAVQERLSEVQSEIEQLEAQRKSLRQRVAYSTITVELNEPRPEREVPETTEGNWHETGLLSAFTASVHGVVVVLRSLAVAGAFGLPYVLAFGVPLVGGYAFWRRRNGSDS
ncbi:DUF4349 domain-containing protein, partial [Halobacteriales archaeon SW_6_65_15]